MSDQDSDKLEKIETEVLLTVRLLSGWVEKRKRRATQEKEKADTLLQLHRKMSILTKELPMLNS